MVVFSVGGGLSSPPSTRFLRQPSPPPSPPAVIRSLISPATVVGALRSPAAAANIEVTVNCPSPSRPAVAAVLPEPPPAFPRPPPGAVTTILARPFPVVVVVVVARASTPPRSNTFSFPVIICLRFIANVGDDPDGEHDATNASLLDVRSTCGAAGRRIATTASTSTASRKSSSSERSSNDMMNRDSFVRRVTQSVCVCVCGCDGRACVFSLSLYTGPFRRARVMMRDAVCGSV